MAITDYQLVITTCPDDELAERLATALVKEGLAACVNIVPGVRSIYKWRGQLESAQERLLIIKSRAADYPAIEQRIVELHSYELPEVITVPIVTGLPAYLAWLENPDGVP